MELDYYIQWIVCKYILYVLIGVGPLCPNNCCNLEYEDDDTLCMDKKIYFKTTCKWCGCNN